MTPQQMTPQEAWTRASRGAAFLDRCYPDWFRRINVQRLELSSRSCCIVGQLFGDFQKVFEAGLAIRLCGERVDAIEMGFTQSDGPAGWSMLQEAWLDLVAARLAAAEASKVVEPSDISNLPPVVRWTHRERQTTDGR